MRFLLFFFFSPTRAFAAANARELVSGVAIIVGITITAVFVI